jgi:hypothetical protein
MQSSPDLPEAESKNFFAAAGEQEREEASAFQSGSVSTFSQR